MGVKATTACRFDETALPLTCKRIEHLVAVGRCPHLTRASNDAGVVFYAVMDSCCHHRITEVHDCDKAEGDWLHLVIRSDGRGTRPKHVFPQYISTDVTFLGFKGTQVDSDKSRLSKDKPVIVPPLYPKAGQPIFGLDSVELDKYPGKQLVRVSVEIKCIARRGSKGKDYRTTLFLSIAIPPKRSGDEEGRPSGGDNGEEGDKMETILSEVLVKTVKMLLSDGWKYIKGRFAKREDEAPESPRIQVDDRILTVDEVSSESLQDVLQAIDDSIHATEIGELKDQWMMYKELMREISALRKAIFSASTAKDRAAAEAQIDRFEEQRKEVTNQICDLVDKLTGKNLHIL